VTCRMPAMVFAHFGSAELDEIGAELDTIFNHILNTIPEA